MYGDISLYTDIIVYMPHVSKHKMGQKINRIANEELRRTLSKSPLQAEILTETEKIMLAKRISIIYLLRIGESSYYIINTLKVSGSTVRRLQKQLWQGDFSNLISYWEKQSNRSGILDVIEGILTAGGALPKRAFIRKKWLPLDEWQQLQRDKQNKFK
jgi:hypothetical protein